MADKPSDKKYSKLARFSSMGIQMGVMIALFTWLGTYLDASYKTTTPWWTIGLSLFGVVGSLTKVVLEVIKMSKDDE